MAYVYIVRCSDGTYYTGAAVDLTVRIDKHNAGAGAKYTRGRTPVELVFAYSAETFSVACKYEYRIKKLTKTKKEILIDLYTKGKTAEIDKILKELGICP